MKRLVIVSVTFLAGCAISSEDGSFGRDEQAVAERGTGQARWVRSAKEADSVSTRIKELLARPLSAEDAAQIALLNNPGLQARYAELGIAEADLVQASRWSGPKLDFARMPRGNEVERETSVFFDVLGLLSIPLSTKAQEKRFAAAEHRAAEEALHLALQTRKAWFVAVAAQQSAKYMEDVQLAAEASAELARRMAETGNWPFLARAREQAFYADTTARLARARLAHTAARERLTRLMGLWSEDIGYVLPERLPELPAEARAGGELEAQALRQRLDMQAVNRAADNAIRARSEVRESYAAYRTAFDIARHYRDEIVPLRKRISEEMLLRYNGMLSSVFELLADSRDAVASVNAYLEAQRDFWIAEADLQMALTTGSPAR
jgi:outer membrane protein TolC